MKIERFLADLGSQKGAPGGGAAAALTGAAGAALVEMVARLNDKRQGKSWGTPAKAAAMRAQFQRLIGADMRVFQRIQKAHKVRREKPELWQSAVKNGAGVPLEIAGACVAASALAAGERDRTSRWLESDRLEALILLKAAFESADLNVEVNLKESSDAAFCASTRKRIAEWRRKLLKF